MIGADAAREGEGDGDGDGDTVDAVLSLLERRHGTSFSNYKPGTIRRRLVRRARLAGAADLEGYRHALLGDEAELDALYDDLLIELTSFFRDAVAFDRVASLVVPDLVGRISRGDSPRVWVPGCASGEEAWSLAMLLIEGAEAAGVEPNVSIVATDLHPRSLGRARQARYPAASVGHLPPGRVARFFEPSANGEVRVRESVRRLVDFHEHDVLGDPPVGSFALVCCRNVLIYFTEAAQGLALEHFREVLVPGGWLVLGASEALIGAVHGFDTVDSRWRIHRRERVASAPARSPGAPFVPVPPHRGARTGSAGRAAAGDDRDSAHGRFVEAGRRAARTLLDAHVTPALLLAPDGTVVRTFGEPSVLLVLPRGPDDEPAPDDPIGRLRPKLRPMLRSALQRARIDPTSRIERPVALEDATGRPVYHDVTIEPLEPVGADGPMLLMMARRSIGRSASETHAQAPSADALAGPESAPVPDPADGAGDDPGSRDSEALDRALAALEASQTALGETRQALAASDEELRSAHEELDTIDVEYRHRMDELARAQRALVTLGREQRAFVDDTDSFVARWRRDDGTLVWCNAAYARLFDDVPESLIGRRLEELLPRDQVEALSDAVERIPPGEVRRTEVVRELPGGDVSYTVALTRAMADGDGRIVEFQSTGQDLSQDYRYRRDLEALIDAVVVPDPDRGAALGRILRIGMRHFDLEGAALGWHEGDVYRVVATRGRTDAWPGPGSTTALANTFCAALPPTGSALLAGCVADGALADHPARAATGQQAYAGARLDARGRTGSVSFFSTRPASRAFDAADEAFLGMISRWISALLAGAAHARTSAPDDPAASAFDASSLDVPAARAPTARARATAAASAARLDRFAHAMSHELRAPLRLISSFSGFLAEDLEGSLDDGSRHQLDVIAGAAERAHRLVGSVFDYAHTEHGTLSPEPVDLAEAARAVLAKLAPTLEAAGAEARVDALPMLSADPALVHLLLERLLVNAVQYRDPARPCRIRILCPPGTVLQVEDDGIGFGSDEGRHILEPFARLSTEHANERSGMGLAVCVAVCVRHGWTLTARGDPGVGATFRVEPGAD